MRRNAGRMLLAAAAVLAVFIGKGSEAKAYEVVGGWTYMTWDEYEAAERRGGAPDGCSISPMYEKRDDMASNLMYYMNDYVPSWYFDYDWYLQKHPELLEICGTDEKAVYAYYANTGQANGWYGRIAPDKLIGLSQFDYARYAAENPDVAAVMGQDAAALYNHYVNNGIKEGRKGYATDDTTNALVKIYEVSSQIIRDDMSDEEKVKAVHDWMCINIAYDEENYRRDTIPEESYGISGAMNKGIAVCNGYAETFERFMEIQGIECAVVEGTAGGGRHAWNQVKLNGEYYFIDVTWDDPVPDTPGTVYWYNYYLTKDSTFGGDHLSNDDEIDQMMEELGL